MAIDEAVRRLHDILPLKGRQQQLDKELLQIHQAILRSFVERGYPLSKKEIADMLSGTDVTTALARLREDDLLILDPESEEPIGAYPMTMENTPHKLAVNGHKIHAMCALDALAVSPMFGVETQIDSRCHVSGKPIYLRQKEMEILEAKPSLDICVGIRWQTPTTCAAHSLCLEERGPRRFAAGLWMRETGRIGCLFTPYRPMRLSSQGRMIPGVFVPV